MLAIMVFLYVTEPLLSQVRCSPASCSSLCNYLPSSSFIVRVVCGMHDCVRV